MIRDTDIREYVRKLAGVFGPRQVILFGSHARGDATEDSDVDLLVVMDDVEDADDTAIKMRLQIPRAFPLDLMVKRPCEVNRRAVGNGGFLRTIFAEGRILYERRRPVQ
ncbi:MAG: hypothetical protein A3K19_32120 [Lentisphaerae bacterium RIFOXYB12_FULL_65_16]|nr:MAG: hypothetical protein A3K18_10900 [Lentisphaerae bacterium RIFOXYA12_64_32]OGV88774.1 MAG: hypothetical protein A3K19_32120 [Lentisphaerae bacterium RIFOXYB12_FULL_65_16]